MKYATVCSGIEAPSMAWEPLSWQAQWFSEIEKFPSAVLQHHYPSVPNLGDMTKIHETDEFKNKRIELLCGGTPCQSFSIAGLRKGLDDPRGNLALTFLSIVDKLKPRWVVWENVPGVLSSYTTEEEGVDGEWQTQDLDTFLRAFREIGYGISYRVLDAQYFGVPQRRRRVFVVGYLGDWRPSAAVLLERESMSGNLKESREKRKAVAARTGKRVSPTVDASINEKWASNQWVDSRRYVLDIYGGGVQDVSIDVSHTLDKSKSDGVALWSIMPQNSGKDYKARKVEVTQPLMGSGPVGGNQGGDVIQVESRVRRLTPLEFERLQGFPDNYTMIPYRGKDAEKCPDGPRYKAVGNSMAVPVMRWIGERISFVDNYIKNERKEQTKGA